eukprot:COSAG01_NODE_6009_length_3904_cov_36.533246_2_plen_84_part_00
MGLASGFLVEDYQHYPYGALCQAVELVGIDIIRSNRQGYLGGPLLALSFAVHTYSMYAPPASQPTDEVKVDGAPASSTDTESG